MIPKGDKVFAYSSLIEAIVDRDDTKTLELTEEALRQGISPEELITSGLQAAMVIVGEKYSTGEFFVPDMLLASRAVTKALDVLKPRLSASGIPTIGRVVIGTVFGDIHDIGKNLVAMFLRGAGFEVFDLGVNVSTDSFVRAVKEHNPDILGISALITTTMLGMRDVIEALEVAELRPKVKVIVGGAPVTQHFAEHIAADGYAADGGSTLKLCRNLVGK
jgi:5-methyltetrahydrofolate--homocysteine methyltransferase